MIDFPIRALGIRDDQLEVSEAMIESQSNALIYTPPDHLRVPEAVVATMASRVERVHALPDAIFSILPFVDQVRVFLHGFRGSFPEILQVG